jgi:hypothetical protein
VSPLGNIAGEVTMRELLANEFGVALENLFLIAEDDDSLGVIAAWYPEVGLRSIIIEDNDLALACDRFLREAGVRRFRSWEELGAAQDREKWDGWDTCADYLRWQQAAEDFAEKGR